jgi:hypothetical protein
MKKPQFNVKHQEMIGTDGNEGYQAMRPVTLPCNRRLSLNSLFTCYQLIFFYIYNEKLYFDNYF